MFIFPYTDQRDTHEQRSFREISQITFHITFTQFTMHTHSLAGTHFFCFMWKCTQNILMFAKKMEWKMKTHKYSEWTIWFVFAQLKGSKFNKNAYLQNRRKCKNSHIFMLKMFIWYITYYYYYKYDRYTDILHTLHTYDIYSWRQHICHMGEVLYCCDISTNVAIRLNKKWNIAWLDLTKDICTNILPLLFWARTICTLEYAKTNHVNNTRDSFFVLRNPMRTNAICLRTLHYVMAQVKAIN